MATKVTLFPSFREGLVELPVSCVRTEHASLTPAVDNVAGYTFISIREHLYLRHFGESQPLTDQPFPHQHDGDLKTSKKLNLLKTDKQTKTFIKLKKKGKCKRIYTALFRFVWSSTNTRISGVGSGYSWGSRLEEWVRGFQSWSWLCGYILWWWRSVVLTTPWSFFLHYILLSEGPWILKSTDCVSPGHPNQCI